MIRETNIINLSKPECIFFDVDGIFTDGSKVYSSQDGSVLSKRFNDIDFTAIKIIKCLGIDLYWISGDSVVNADIAKLRSIPFLLTRDKDGNALKKSVLIKEICKEKHYDLKNVWFIGDDFFDLSAIKICGHTFCPENSYDAIKKEVDVVIPRMSGQYLAAWLVDYLINKLNLEYPTEEDIANKEKEENQKY